MTDDQKQQNEDNRQMIYEIREWLMRIDTNQAHQTKLLESLTTQADNAFEKADSADHKANEAIKRVDRIERDLGDYQHGQLVGRRWAIGVAVSLGAVVAPVILTFYV